MDIAHLNTFETFVTPTHFQARSFLNRIGSDGGAHIVLDQHQLRSQVSFSLKIADCHKSITLEFNDMTGEDKSNALHKIEKLEAVLLHMRKYFETQTIRSTNNT